MFSCIYIRDHRAKGIWLGDEFLTSRGGGIIFPEAKREGKKCPFTSINVPSAVAE
jgi:hypothetical protein